MFLKTEERPQGEVQQDTRRLSTALRIGASLRPQCKGKFFDGRATCALGAIAEARGWIPTSGPRSGVYDFMPECRGSLGASISNLNDTGHSRESIADWLASQGL